MHVTTRSGVHYRQQLRRHVEKIYPGNERDQGSERESGEGETQTVRKRSRWRSHNQAGDERAKRALAPQLSATHRDACTSMPIAIGRGSARQGIEKKVPWAATATPAARTEP